MKLNVPQKKKWAVLKLSIVSSNLTFFKKNHIDFVENKMAESHENLCDL